LRKSLFKEDFTAVGYLKKTFRIDGHIKFDLSEDYFDSIDKVDHIFVLIDGQHIPYRIEEISDEGGMSILFKGLDTAEKAQLLCNREVFLPTRIVSDVEVEEVVLGYSYLKGYTLYDQEKKIGEISDVIENPAHQIAVVSYNGVEKLIPLHKSMISYINHENKTIITELPEGLLTL
jgi:16S rRNA processing protein RimM